MGILDFTVFQDGMVLVTNFTQVRIHPPIGQKYLFGRVFTRKSSVDDTIG